jgi:RNA-binding protein Musashi
VSQECTEQYFKEFFMKFGRVIDATLMMDKDTGRPRGFGFVTFDGEDAVDRTLMQPLNIHGKPIEVKRAEPRGNMQDEKGGAHKQPFNKRDRFAGGGREQQGNSFDGGDQSQFQPGGQNAQATAGMSQAQMAQYWFKMQEYFRNMQQAMAAQSVQAQGMGMMQGGMNPAMMQQMMMNQPRMMSPGGTPMGPNGGMSPAMMQQMQSQQAQMMQQQQQPQVGFGGPPPTAPAGPQAAMMGRSPSTGASRPGFNAQEQMMFEQQKYERQQQARMQQSQYAAQQGMGGPTSWEGMYDDVPAPHVMAPTGPAGGRGNFGGRGNRGGQKHQHNNTPPAGPVNAPPNAPTGPKNAGNRPGGNYRGGGRGRGGRGWAPY